jgi:hypothetical protein
MPDFFLKEDGVCQALLPKFEKVRKKFEKVRKSSNLKSGKVLEIMGKLGRGKIDKARHEKADEDPKLANIMSAVANRNPSLNMVNIWDLTVFQPWDCFHRISC